MAGLLARPSPSVRVNVGVLAATLLPLELYLGEFGTQPIATSNTSRIGAIATILLFPVFVSMPHVSSNTDRNLSAGISPQVRQKSCRSGPEIAYQSGLGSRTAMRVRTRISATPTRPSLDPGASTS